MAVFDLFSKRQKRLRGEVPDVYQYDEIPNPLRVQIVQILDDVIGRPQGHNDNARMVYKYIHKALSREYGVFKLSEDKGGAFNPYSGREYLFDFFLETTDVDKAIDVIELSFRYVSFLDKDYSNHKLDANVSSNPKDAIGELNTRLKEHGVGYQFEDKQMIRVDSKYMHSEVVKPSLVLLMNRKFAGANDEYRKAHDHYKKGKNKECLAECLKAFESTMKIICTEKGWTYNPTDTAKKLIYVCMQNGLIPTYAQNQFSSLKTLLETGVPPVRNKLGGHGQGQTPQKVNDEIARYALNLTGANVIFLVELSGIK